MLFPGATRCAPGDWAGCAAGFVPSDAGWGCDAVLPAQPCTGATREALGEATCRPIGDCAAPAPADATHFVDAALAGPEDATHFRSIAGAVAAAPSGAKIFIRPGQYPQPLTLSRPVQLVGQCPRDVQVQGSLAAGSLAPAVRVTSPGVSLEGLTLRGGFVGLSIAGGGAVVAKDLVLDGNGATGVSLAEAGASVALASCAIRNTAPAGSGSGWGLSVQLGSTATLADCALVANHVTALRASGAGSTVRATGVVVRDTAAGAALDWGRAAVAQRGAFLELTRAAVLGSVEIGVVVAEGSVATLADVLVRGTRPNSAGAFGRAINVADGSRLTLSTSTLSHNRDAALMVAGAGSFADVRDSVVYATTGSSHEVARGITVQESGGLALSGSAVVGSVEGGVVIVDDGSFGALARCAIFDTQTERDGGFGHGLVGGLSTVGLRACHLGSSAGVGLALGPGSFVAEDLTLSDNGTGLFADGVVSVTVRDQVPASAGLNEAVISTSTRFIGNRATTGAGVLALPPGLGR